MHFEYGGSRTRGDGRGARRETDLGVLLFGGGAVTRDARDAAPPPPLRLHRVQRRGQGLPGARLQQLVFEEHLRQRVLRWVWDGDGLPALAAPSTSTAHAQRAAVGCNAAQGGKRASTR